MAGTSDRGRLPRAAVPNAAPRPTVVSAVRTRTAPTGRAGSRDDPGFDGACRLLELLALHTGELLNLNGLATALGLHRTTVDNYLGALERLFVVRRLPARHRNAAKRLIKAPKIHVSDSGLGAALADLTADAWLDKREELGHLLESFVVQQLVAQAAWTDPDLRFWHYRDKDKPEVDLVITRGRRTWGVEVKSATRIGAKDGAGLLRLADQCGADFRQGIVLYSGTDSLPMSDERLLAVPLRELWVR